jgi:DNA-directed RNA polymerase subunit beta'
MSNERPGDLGSRLRISLAGPTQVRSWSHGEVTRPDLLDRTGRPAPGGLFCERIFGPRKGAGWLGRMGHVELAAPVVHPYFFRDTSILSRLLWLKGSALDKVIRYEERVVVDPGETPLKRGQLLSENEHREATARYGDSFLADEGAWAIRKLLDFDLAALIADLRRRLDDEMKKDVPSRRKLLGQFSRLEVAEGLRDSGLSGEANRPDWAILECLPVIPPGLRPRPSGGINGLYGRVIIRNNRLKKLIELNAPEVIVRNEKRKLQQCVEALLSGRRLDRLLEARLGGGPDRSVGAAAVAGPELKVRKCGLPRDVAMELFRPLVVIGLTQRAYAETYEEAAGLFRRRDAAAWEVLEEVVRDRVVLVGRTPARGRTALQAFEPVLCDGGAVRLPVAAWEALGGEEVVVHLPLTDEAQADAAERMTPGDNLLDVANGGLLLKPSRDVVAGCYHLTVSPLEGEGKAFAGVEEVRLAFALGKVGVHDRIRVRLPHRKRLISEDHRGRVEEARRAPGGRVATTVGRVLFNDALDARMPFYDATMSARLLEGVIHDCHSLLGRHAALTLLDRVKEVGLREATRSGLSLAVEDLKTPATREAVLRATDREVQRRQRQYDEGNICESERYHQTIDAWTKARDEVAKAVADDLSNDRRDGKPGLNPLYLLAHSGAAGGVEQIRQLCGLRGLLASPDGTLIETPVRSNFREGLSVLEYSLGMGALRKEAVDLASRTQKADRLTRKLIGAAQDVIVTMHDCGTTQGIVRPVSETIRGRVHPHGIENPLTGEAILGKDEILTDEEAREVEALGIDRILARSPMTCLAPRGVCRLCYGMDLATGALVEEGAAVGVVAALSLGEPADRLTPRTFRGFTRNCEVGGEAITRKGGRVRYVGMEAVVNDRGERVALCRGAGEIRLVGPGDRVVEEFAVPHGAVLRVADGEQAAPPVVLAQWDPHVAPVLSERPGVVRLVDVVEGQTLRRERDETAGLERFVISEHRGDLYPQVRLENDQGRIVGVHFLPERAILDVREGQEVSAGTTLARLPREISFPSHYNSGLGRLTELFEARAPENPAVMAQVDGVVRFDPVRRRGQRIVYVRMTDEDGRSLGREIEHAVPPGRHLRVSSGDRVRAGDLLTAGPVASRDVLKIQGPEAARTHLLSAIQDVYRSQGVEIDDRHVEVVITQMLRRVQVHRGGDTGLLPGSIIDRFAFQAVNERLRGCVKITDAGASRLRAGEVVARELYDQEYRRIQREGGRFPQCERAYPAAASLHLLGVSEAARSESFLAAACQGAAEALAGAAWAGKVDDLEGLTANALLGRLIPAGSGRRGG